MWNRADNTRLSIPAEPGSGVDDATSPTGHGTWRSRPLQRSASPHGRRRRRRRRIRSPRPMAGAMKRHAMRHPSEDGEGRQPRLSPGRVMDHHTPTQLPLPPPGLQTPGDRRPSPPARRRTHQGSSCRIATATPRSSSKSWTIACETTSTARTCSRDSPDLIAGERFEARLLGQIREADVVLVVIGPRWTVRPTILRLHRLADADDFVRRGAHPTLDARAEFSPIPVLVDGAAFPRRARRHQGNSHATR